MLIGLTTHIRTAVGWAANSDRFMSKFELVFDSMVSHLKTTTTGHSNAVFVWLKYDSCRPMWKTKRRREKCGAKSGFAFKIDDSLFHTVFLFVCWCETCKKFVYEMDTVGLCNMEWPVFHRKRNKQPLHAPLCQSAPSSPSKAEAKTTRTNCKYLFACFEHITFGSALFNTTLVIVYSGNFHIEHLSKR